MKEVAVLNFSFSCRWCLVGENKNLKNNGSTTACISTESGCVVVTHFNNILYPQFSKVN